MRASFVGVVLLLSACGSHSFNQLKDVTVTPPQITGPRRGPIILRWGLDDPDHQVTGVRLERGSQSGWVPATVTTVERNDSSALVVWDSFSDVNIDSPQKVRLVALEARGSAMADVTIDVWNDPETDRLILSGHDLKDDGTGGAVGEGTRVAALGWNAHNAAITGDPIDVTVGIGPHDLRASPNGRATVVLEDRWGTLSVLFTPLNAHPTEVRVISAVTPSGGVADTRWSPDGRYLYAATYAVADKPAAIWRWEPTEDLSSLGEGTNLGPLPGPPAAFAVEPGTGHLLVACGPGNTTGVPKLTVHDRDGVELARLEQADLGTHQIAIHPLGGMALLVPDFFGQELHRVTFTNSTLAVEGEPLTVNNPWEIVFHPRATRTSGSALVSNQDSNTVTPLNLFEHGQSAGTPVGRIPLASEMDLIERGSQMGTVFITAVTQIYRVQLASDGTVTNKGAIYDFGMDTEDLLSGIAVQR